MKRPFKNEAHPRRNNGSLVITADERTGSNNEMVEVSFQASFPKDTEGFKFFIVSRMVTPNQYVPIYKSEIVAVNDRYYKWKMFEVMTSALCKEEDDRDIRIDFYRSAKSGKHRFLGQVNFIYSQIKNEQREFQIKKDIKQVGTLKMADVRINRRHTFLEYIFGGCEIQLSIAVDFTLSNGNPQDRDSLHYFDLAKNEYLQAI